jgi:hypothetical protein
MFLNYLEKIDHSFNEDILIFHGTFSLGLQQDNCKVVGVIWKDFKDNSLKFEGTIHSSSEDNKVIESFYNFLDKQEEYKLTAPNYKPCKVRITTLDLTKENIIPISGRIFNKALETNVNTKFETLVIDVCN